MYRLFYALLALFIPEIVFAEPGDEVFSVPPTDYSLTLFGQIFGGNIGPITLNGGANPILANMFEKFNFIVMTAGVAVISYIAVVSVINTAKSGEMMGKKWSSIWVPMRSMIGMLVMIPTPGTGYSMVQATVMWIVLQGVGAANSIWEVVLDQLATGIPVAGSVDVGQNASAKPNVTEVNNLVKQLLASSVCAATINEAAKGEDEEFIVNKYSKITSKFIPAQVNDGTYDGYFKIGIHSSNVPAGLNLDSICGSFQITGTANDDSTAESTSIAKLSGIASIYSTVSPLALAVVNNSAINGGGYMSLAANSYTNEILTLATNSATGNAMSDAIQIAKENGWIHAGSYYYVMTHKDPGQTATLSGDAKSVPTGNTLPLESSASGNKAQLQSFQEGMLGNFLDSSLISILSNNLKIAYDKSTSDSNITANNSLSIPGFSLPSVDLPVIKEILKAFDDLATGALTGLKHVVAVGEAAGDIVQNSEITYNGGVEQYTGDTQGQFASAINSAQNSYIGYLTRGEPLFAIGKFGIQLMGMAETAWLAIVGIAFVASLIAGVCFGELPIGFGFLVFIITAIPVILGALILLWGTGAMLGIYTPMIPYIIFTTATIGWAIYVIEAVIAAPIVALGFVAPSNDELGKIAPGLHILTNIFLRPSLMIFAFVIASRLLGATINLVNFGFHATIEASIAGKTLFSIIIVLILYTSFILAITNKCFSLIYIIPDKIMRWIGGTAENNDGADVMRDTKGQYDKGSSAAGESMKGLSDGSANASAGYIKQKRAAALEKKNAGSAD